MSALYLKDKNSKDVYCTSLMCYHYGSCSRLSAKDFKFKIGGSNESLSTPMYFSVPSSSYLIDSKDLGISGDFCILGITGYVPNEMN